MNANAAKVQSILETTFISAIDRVIKENSGNLISDLYIQADSENGEIQIYDDNENLLGKVVIFDWVNKQEEEEHFIKQVTATLKTVVTALSTKNVFENPPFMKPLSISLTDDDFVVIEELLFLDDDMFRLDDPLLKDLDAELDNFLKDLLSDV